MVGVLPHTDHWKCISPMSGWFSGKRMVADRKKKKKENRTPAGPHQEENPSGVKRIVFTRLQKSLRFA